VTYADAANKPIDLRAWWSKYGLWASLFAVLQIYWVARYEGVGFSWLMPLSILWSASTILRLVGIWWRPVRFWTPYVVKWLSWLIANLVGFFLLVCMVYSWIGGFCAYNFYLALPFILVPPIWRLIVHIRSDIRSIRAANGSVASQSISHTSPLRVGGQESFNP